MEPPWVAQSVPEQENRNTTGREGSHKRGIELRPLELLLLLLSCCDNNTYILLMVLVLYLVRNLVRRNEGTNIFGRLKHLLLTYSSRPTKIDEKTR